MNLIAPFGFYGWGNIGDESTLQGFGRLVGSFGGALRVAVASRDPRHTSQVEPTFRHYRAVGWDPRRWWAQTRAEGAVVPGGTPIMDVLGDWPLSELIPLIVDAHRRGRPVAFVGTGTERLHRDASRQRIADELAPRVLRWSVRCERDRARLLECGVDSQRITVAGDLAWLLDGEDLAFGRECLRGWGLDPGQTLVGVNVNSERFVLAKEPRLFEKLAALLDRLVGERALRVLFFCNEVREGEGFDKVAAERICARMTKSDHAFIVPNRYWSPRQMLSLIGCCRATIGIRLHFCLFSALQRVPFIALQRSDKVADLCWTMGWPFGVSLDEIDELRLHAMYDELDRDHDALAGTLERCSREMREQALRNRVPLEALREAGRA